MRKKKKERKRKKKNVRFTLLFLFIRHGSVFLYLFLWVFRVQNKVHDRKILCRIRRPWLWATIDGDAGVWKVYPAKELNVATIVPSFRFINKLHHDHYPIPYVQLMILISMYTSCYEIVKQTLCLFVYAGLTRSFIRTFWCWKLWLFPRTYVFICCFVCFNILSVFVIL